MWLEAEAGEIVVAVGTNSFFVKPPPHFGRVGEIFGRGVNILGVVDVGGAAVAEESVDVGGDAVLGGGTNGFDLGSTDVMFDSFTGVMDILGLVGIPNTLGFGV